MAGRAGYVGTPGGMAQELARLLRVVIDGCGGASGAQGAVKVLAAVVGNCVRHPGQEKYETLKLSNEKFHAVWGRRGVKDFLRAAQFVERGGAVVLRENRDAEVLRAAAAACEAALLDIHETLSRQKEAAVAAAHDAAIKTRDAEAREAARLRDLQLLCSYVEDPDAAKAALQALPPVVAPDVAQALRRLRDDVAANTARCFPSVADFADVFRGTDLDHLRVILQKLWAYPHDAKYRSLKYASVAKRFPPSELQHDRVLEFLRRVGFKPVSDETLTFHHAGAADSPPVLAPLFRGGGCGAGQDWAASPACVAVLSGVATLSTVLRQQLKDDQEKAAEDEAARAALRGKPPPKAYRGSPPRGLLCESQKERDLAATQLISDIQGFMEQEWLLRGAVGYEAPYRKEGRALLDRYKARTVQCEDLHRIRAHWEAKVERTKIETGRSMLSTIRVVRAQDTAEPDDDPPAAGS